MKINLNSVFVDDQTKALQFYTTVLGFVKKQDLPAGEFRWLTVVSPDGPEDVELLLEPNATSIARTYQQDCFAAGIPAAQFEAKSVQEDFERLRGMGVEFHQAPTKVGTVTLAVFDDTCGNLIQIAGA